MKHMSVKLDAPCEFINITPVNPLISKCQIKVCYVGDTPNRNRSVISKEVAREMANSLPGSPIVGYYNNETKDFEEHSREMEIKDGQVIFKDITRPYGFVDFSAKCWFQKFQDDGENEHEYLMTEGYLWTGQYPEAQRIIEKGNNQSMELDDKFIDATWTKDNNGKPRFFIINEAIISKLCILGEDFEPCFEGANITKIEFSLEDNFKTELSSMMNQLKEILNKGGEEKPMFKTFAVQIGDTLWNNLYSYLNDNGDCSKYCVEGIFEEEENAAKFAMVKSKEDSKYFRLDFSFDDENGFSAVGELTEVVEYTPAEEPQFALADIEAFENEFKAKKSEEEKKDEDSDQDKDDKSNQDNSDNKTEDKKSDSDEEEDDEKNKKKYNLEEIPEYTDLASKYSALEENYNNLLSEKNNLESQITELKNFKLNAERKQKEDMIQNTFYMLSDEDKADVINNIDKYSLDEIEAKLSILCVRNKVSFAALEEENDNSGHQIFHLDDTDNDDSVPAWIKAVLDTAKTLN